MIRDTISPTMLQAGYKINVIPAEAVGFLDARILPGETPEEFRKKLEKKIADPNVKIETVLESLPNQSDFKTPYFEAVEKSILAVDPTAAVAPYMSPGATDSRFFRAKGAICYGLIPVVATQEEIDTIHGKNERVRISGLAQGEKILYNIVTSLQGGGDGR
jgi:acetylornithine deacetylase/succinyl-diaminopimelate desuccinylase-like protein